MAPLTATGNYSIFSIPAYFVLSITPHLYSSTLLKPTKPNPNAKGKPQPRNLYNLANPRSSRNTDTYANGLNPEVYAKFERCRAAHNNLLENSGFFVSAVLAGVVAKLDPGFMNKMAAAYLATRVAYIISYVSVSRGPLALLRTLWFFAGYGCLFAMWWAAGVKIVNGEY